MAKKGKKIGFFVPTLNAVDKIKPLLARIDQSKTLFDRVLAIDSGSNDGTIPLLQEHHLELKTIAPEEFTHGLVRKLAINYLADCDYVVMTTQDVEPKADAFSKLVDFIIDDPSMASAYGKQLVDLNRGTIFEARSREFNYPNHNLIKTSADISSLGIKTIFQSDAFVVYNVAIVKKLGNFPAEINFGEDQYMAATAINAGFSVGYVAEAQAYHQHNYTLKEEYHRFLATGEFNRQYQELLNPFGTNEKEGFQFVAGELKFYCKNGMITKIPRFLAICVAKFLGYKLG